MLFLDELPEFKRSVLEVLRQPMEERVITISRARTSVEFPANFMLVAAMNPGPFQGTDHLPSSETSSLIRERVIKARKIQEQRFRGSHGIYCNAQIPSKKLHAICAIGEEGHLLLKNAMERINLSARAYNRILKVARTIADLEASVSIKTEHLAEAIQYRSLDRENWGS